MVADKSSNFQNPLQRILLDKRPTYSYHSIDSQMIALPSIICIHRVKPGDSPSLGFLVSPAS
jgi:hypothetical protein